MKKKVVIFATYSLWDPPIQNSIFSFSERLWNIVIVQSQSEIPLLFMNKNFKIISINDYRDFKVPALLRTILAWIIYWVRVKRILAIEKPDLVIAEMHRPISAIPAHLFEKTICFIPDIPSLKHSGKLDTLIIKNAWAKIKKCSLVWASDEYKAKLTQQFAQLKYLPFTCHNCPRLDYFDNINKDDARNWLFDTLKKNQVYVNNHSIIILRAGAVGEYGGIEETILSMKRLPVELVFILMGRPEENYKVELIKFIHNNEMNHRVYFFNRPDDLEWKKILSASDIGHLIHINPVDNPAIAANYSLNSSLSNNRLFQYMAAGLPIISYNDPRMDIIYNEVDCFEVVDLNDFLNGLTETISKLLQNSERRKELGENAKKAFNEKYNWEKQFALIMQNIS